MGEQFLIALNSLVQTIRIHQDNNQLVKDCVKKFTDSVHHLISDDDSLTIQVYGGRFYFQDEKLTLRKKSEQLFKNMLQYFEKRGLQEMCIYQSITNAASEQILTFARLLNQAEHEEKPLDWLIHRVEEEDLPWVIIEHPDEQDAPETDDSPVEQDKKELSVQERKDRGRKDYSYALASIKEMGQKLFTKKRSGIRKGVRIVQNMVEHLIQDESIYLTLSTIKVYDDYTYTHSVNVAILSMCLGKHIKLPKPAMERLGICGLFHDLGKIWLPPDILNKPGKLNDQEFKEIQMHSLNSARLIVRLRASRDRKAKILLAPFEHHLKYNLQGYPFVQWQKPISLFGRILAIADVYDALTSARVYRSEPLTPDQALAKMQEGSGTDFDPLLLKVFINMLGVYPLGTLLLLDNGIMGLVSGASESEELDRPRILLLEPDGQRGFVKGAEVDLRERHPQTGDFLRNVVQSVHPSAYGIQPAQYLLQE